MCQQTETSGRGWKWTAGILAIAGAMLALGTANADAAGMLIADGGQGGVLEIKEHSVQVTINNGIAVTKVNQTFQNTENRQVEALYMFPVPKGASVANFSMWINGKEMVGEVLEKKRARQIYNSYKRVRRDPGLLEQVDYKTFEMRIFPIGPKAEQKVQITYYQQLDFDHDWANYVYPLATAPKPGIVSRTQGKFALTMRVKSEVPIVTMESPSHGKDFVIARHTDSFHEASLETKGGDLNRDVVLAYRVSRPRTGLDLITSKQPGEDGYFMLTLTAGKELAKKNAGMDYVFVLDISGSMAHGGKLGLSRQSVGAFVSELGKQDRFEVITFNVGANTLFNKLQPADKPHTQAAVKFLRSQQARGGTVLRPAIAAAYKYGEPDRPLNVVILSDGMTEQRERRELLQLIKARPQNARVFCIGVGNEVNRPLLSQVAEDAGGLAAFLSRGANFQRQAKAFRRKLMRPAAANVRITFDGIEAYDVEPKTLPNLYHGMPVRLYGRYRAGGSATARVQAEINGAPLDNKVALTFPKSEGTNPEIERMWAWQKVNRLLKQADRSGSRTGVVDEIVRIGEEYSIVTEYTSFLVLENDAEYRRWKIERRNLRRVSREDRQQQALQARLDALRNKAMADLGPNANGPKSKPGNASPQQQVANRPAQPAANPNPSSPGDLDVRSSSPGIGGGGAIDPLTGLALLTLAGFGAAYRRKRKPLPGEKED
ncbi:MAG: VIT domain-containing protein [Planctomycetaceae bacterium]